MPPGTPPRIAEKDMAAYHALAERTLDRMVAVFEPDDRLLASIGTVVVYYIVFRDEALAAAVDREKLVTFEELRRRGIANGRGRR